uniref:Uncharacterized protein n=1 Tax=Solanum lycopersicum TaxID=4081 RepID=A0A3Q7JBD8_SOLLC
MGVPIAAWITHSDQSMTAFLVTEMLKVGLIVREWQKREEMVTASTMRNVVRKLMTSQDRVVNYVLDLCIYLLYVCIIYAKFDVGRKLQESSVVLRRAREKRSVSMLHQTDGEFIHYAECGEEADDITG